MTGSQARESRSTLDADAPVFDRRPQPISVLLGPGLTSRRSAHLLRGPATQSGASHFAGGGSHLFQGHEWPVLWFIT